MHPWSGGELPDGETLGEMAELMVELFGEERRHFAEQLAVGRYRLVRRAWSAREVMRHLRGELTMAAYPIRQESGGAGLARWVCHDLDAGAESLEQLRKLLGVYDRLGLTPAVQAEFSGRRGFHVWVFGERMPAALLRRLGRHAASLVGLARAELFPKQGSLQGESLGNPVKLPLGIHRVSGKRCVFARSPEEPISLRESRAVFKRVLERRLSAELVAQLVPPVKRADCVIDQSGASYEKHLLSFAESHRACVQLVERGVERGRRHDAALLLLGSYRARGLSREEAGERLLAVDAANRPPLSSEERAGWAERKAGYVYGRKSFRISCYWAVIQEAGWCSPACELYGLMFDDEQGVAGAPIPGEATSTRL